MKKLNEYQISEGGLSFQGFLQNYHEDLQRAYYEYGKLVASCAYTKKAPMSFTQFSQEEYIKWCKTKGYAPRGLYDPRYMSPTSSLTGNSTHPSMTTQRVIAMDEEEVKMIYQKAEYEKRLKDSLEQEIISLKEATKGMADILAKSPETLIEDVKKNSKRKLILIKKRSKQ